MGRHHQILELACGTGIWTKWLLAIGDEITAVDAAPEMLELNVRNVHNMRVRYQVVDLFAWHPEQQYDNGFRRLLDLARASTSRTSSRPS